MQDVAQPLKDAAAKAMKSVGGKRGSKTDEELNEDIRLEDSKFLKNTVDAILRLKEEAANINADIKSRYDAAADQGIDRAALKTIIKARTKEVSQEHKQNVNQYCLLLDMPTIYRLDPVN